MTFSAAEISSPILHYPPYFSASRSTSWLSHRSKWLPTMNAWPHSHAYDHTPHLSRSQQTSLQLDLSTAKASKKRIASCASYTIKRSMAGSPLITQDGNIFNIGPVALISRKQRPTRNACHVQYPIATLFTYSTASRPCYSRIHRHTQIQVQGQRCVSHMWSKTSALGAKWSCGPGPYKLFTALLDCLGSQRSSGGIGARSF